jgi:hypothetical protein
VCKITGVLKGFWGRLTDMETEVKELRGAVEAGFAEMQAEFKTVFARMPAYDACALAHVRMTVVASLHRHGEPA